MLPDMLTPEREARARAMRARAHELDPQFVSFVKSLLDAGLIDGWRNVRFVGNEEEWQAYAATRPQSTNLRLDWDEMRR